MRLVIYLVAALAFGASNAARAQVLDEVTLENDTTISIKGAITTDTVDKFRSLLTDKVEVVKVFSGGGHPLAAMDIGRIIHSRKLSLYIPVACTAACAQYIFMAAEKRFADPLALIGFSTSPSGMELMTAADEDFGVRVFFTRMADTEKAYYAEIGAPQEMLLIPQVLLNIACYTLVRDAGGRLLDVSVEARFQIFVPKKSYLEGSKIAVTGFWPSDAETFTAMMKKQVRPESFPRFIWGGPDGPLTPALLEEFKTRARAPKQCAAKLP